MPFVFKRLVLFLSIAVACAADKETAKFEVRPAAEYGARQTNGKVTIATQAYVSDDEARVAFGKNNPYQFGVLPLLVVIQNGSDQTIRVDAMKVEYVSPDRRRIYATPARDVRFLSGTHKPNVTIGPQGPKLGRQKKNPLDSWEIEGRAFAAKMIPAGETASGFYYFQTGYQRGATLYISGVKEARSGEELFYFEIPLADAMK